MKSLDPNINNLYNFILKLTLFLGIATSPLYLLNSGLPQLSHLFLFLFSILVLLKFGISLDRYFYFFLFFVSFSFLVNIFYIYKDLFQIKFIEIKYLRVSVFLIYNFIITISLISYFRHQKNYDLVLYGLVFSILIIFFHLIYEIFSSKLGYRYTAFYNNPNQLGYFSTCCFALIYLMYRNLYLSYSLMIVFISMIFIFSILSLSKAAIVAIGVCAIFAIKPLYHKNSKIIFIIICLAIIYTIIYFFDEIIKTNVFFRMMNMVGESDSSLDVRGYFVFLEGNIVQLIFGMGPKNAIEFHGYEIHSTFASILSLYGLIGVLLFALLTFSWMIYIKNKYGLIGLICVCGPPLLYGLTHNGIRFSFFWVVFAVSLLIEINPNNKNFSNNK